MSMATTIHKYSKKYQLTIDNLLCILYCIFCCEEKIVISGCILFLVIQHSKLTERDALTVKTFVYRMQTHFKEDICFQSVAQSLCR